MLQDTFLDAAHLKACFPNRAVVFTNLDPGATPLPPFRVIFPELQTKTTAEQLGKRKADEIGEQVADAKAAAEQQPLLVEVRAARHVPVRLPPLLRSDWTARDDSIDPTREHASGCGKIASTESH